MTDGAQLAPHVRRIGGGTVNVYLIADGADVTIVDAGAPAYYGDLGRELAAMGRTIGDVRAVVLTHGHSDHIGFAERIRREQSVPVSVHELDAGLARGEDRNPASGLGPVRPVPLLRFLLLSVRLGMLRIPPIAEVSTFGDGATLDVPGTPHVIALPGHTPGSAALHFERFDALCVGDAFATLAVTTGRTGPRLAPFTADPARAMQSLHRLDSIEAHLVLPGHGEAWTAGVSAALQAVRRGAQSDPLG
jgi:glyoxylase-like metal-dependent hydrolase (beta-lactamase superfamily II)